MKLSWTAAHQRIMKIGERAFVGEGLVPSRCGRPQGSPLHGYFRSKEKAVYIICGILVMLACVVAMSACAKEPAIDESQVREYADPITEDILLAMNEDNYAKYCEHFSETMKNAVPEDVFKETNAIIKDKIGEYQSKKFWKVEDDTFVTVYYKANFSDEPEDVIVKVVFQEIEEEMRVFGLWLNSPKLRGK